MKAKKNRLASAFLVIGAAALVAGATTAPQSDGKSIYLENKCQNCHSLKAQGISKAATSEAVTMKTTPPDLSGVGKKRSAEWMIKYLQKKEALNGEKHLKKFKGTDADLTTLSNWLALQKK
jgi:cbb3-type cytochrome oxidase cytochrome c subunit